MQRIEKEVAVRMMLRSGIAALALLVAIGLSTPQTRAHDAEKGPHGGQVIEVKGHHVELTTEGNTLVLFFSNEAHAAIQTRGASGRIVILEGSKQTTAPLAPAEPDRLVAQLAAPPTPGARVVVTAKLADGHDIVARFVVK